MTPQDDPSAQEIRHFGMRPDHWLYAEPRADTEDVPVFYMNAERFYYGLEDSGRSRIVANGEPRYWRLRIEDAVRRGIKGATGNGRIQDFDPDAMVIDIVNAICGPSANVVSVQSPEPPQESTSDPHGD